MKKFSDRQKYLIIMWHYLLTDLQKNDIENIIEHKYPGFKIDYGGMSDRISWAADRAYSRSDIYPWIIRTKNREGVNLHVGLEELCDP